MAKSNRKEPKRKFALWIKDSTLALTKEFYPKDNCSSQSEFIEKAILFMSAIFLPAKTIRIFLT